MKRVFTSNYARFGNHPRAISISVGGAPRWNKKLKVYEQLWPTRESVNSINAGKTDVEQYTTEYLATLAERNMTPQAIYDLVQDGDVLLCYEKATDFCHRQIVAELLRDAGATVVEIKSADDYDTYMSDLLTYE